MNQKRRGLVIRKVIMASIKRIGGSLVLFSLSLLLGFSATGKKTIADNSHFITISGVIEHTGTIISLEIKKQMERSASPKVENGELAIKLLSKSGEVLAENTVVMERALVDVDGPTGDPNIDSGEGMLMSTKFKVSFPLEEKASWVKFYFQEKLVKTEKLE